MILLEGVKFKYNNIQMSNKTRTKRDLLNLGGKIQKLIFGTRDKIENAIHTLKQNQNK